MSFDEEHLGEHHECQREFELMQRTARAYAARLREAVDLLHRDLAAYKSEVPAITSEIEDWLTRYESDGETKS